jgi:transcriptional regulator with XRE-family HTH domain
MVSKQQGVRAVNRSRRAREGAGLTLEQAARFLGMPADQLRSIEENDAAYADADVPRLADIYGVNIEWLSGRCELYDYAALKGVRGAEDLPFHDRDMLAELYASLPRKRSTPR